MGIIIKNALVVVPQGEEDVIKETSLYIEGDRITGIGQAPAGFQEEKVIDGTDRLVIPGLINCHTHSYMSFMRNVADDLSFMDWLFGTIDPIEQQMTDEDTYWGANLAIIEMMKSGTTCFNDMQMNIHQTTRAMRADRCACVRHMKKGMRQKTVTDLPFCSALTLLIHAMTNF